ncbi:MAG: SUMF1/EgtB/PvdO family nonheme iron enzyme [Pseudomonadota bacterium]
MARGIEAARAMRAALRAALFAAAAALLMLGSAAAQGRCANALSASCAQRLGAGAIAADDAVCQQQWSAYRACIKRMAEAGETANRPTASPSCSEARAQSLWADVKEANDCISYESFLAACPATPEARLAEGRMRRLNCAGADQARSGAPSPEASADTDFRSAQRELTRLGFYSGPIDGDWGPASQAAMRAFEAAHGVVPVDGVLGPTSLAALKAAPSPAAPTRRPGEAFRDCAACPEMTALPGGRFLMGSAPSEAQREPDEGPQRRVDVAAFAIGVAEVSFAEWDQCVAAGGCAGYRPDDRGWGRGAHPVINVSKNDAEAYLAWLNAQVPGAPYRLPSEAEWEYAARAGAETAFWWGGAITPAQANYKGSQVYQGGGAAGVFRRRTTPARSFAANPFGLFDVHGNVREWVAECWRAYGAASCDDASVFVIRGGAWSNGPWALRSANRFRNKADVRNNAIGFRVARDL